MTTRQRQRPGGLEILAIVWLWLCAPVGVIIVWFSKRWPTWLKLALTLGLIFGLVWSGVAFVTLVSGGCMVRAPTIGQAMRLAGHICRFRTAWQSAGYLPTAIWITVFLIGGTVALLWSTDRFTSNSNLHRRPNSS